MRYVSSNATWKANIGKSAELKYGVLSIFKRYAISLWWWMWDTRSCILHSLSKQDQAGHTFCLTMIQHEKPTWENWTNFLESPNASLYLCDLDVRRQSYILHGLSMQGQFSKQGQGGDTFFLKYNMDTQHEKIRRNMQDHQTPCYICVMMDVRRQIMHTSRT